MNDEFEKWFETIMYRPIDPFLYKHYKDMNDEVRRNHILDYSEEVKNGMKILKKKKNCSNRSYLQCTISN